MTWERLDRREEAEYAHVWIAILNLNKYSKNGNLE
jgi:hypothetical protein